MTTYNVRANIICSFILWNTTVCIAREINDVPEEGKACLVPTFKKLWLFNIPVSVAIVRWHLVCNCAADILPVIVLRTSSLHLPQASSLPVKRNEILSQDDIQKKRDSLNGNPVVFLILRTALSINQSVNISNHVSDKSRIVSTVTAIY